MCNSLKEEEKQKRIDNIRGIIQDIKKSIIESRERDYRDTNDFYDKKEKELDELDKRLEEERKLQNQLLEDKINEFKEKKKIADQDENIYNLQKNEKIRSNNLLIRQPYGVLQPIEAGKSDDLFFVLNGIIQLACNFTNFHLETVYEDNIPFGSPVYFNKLNKYFNNRR
jgi:hypothetical protein